MAEGAEQLAPEILKLRALRKFPELDPEHRDPPEPWRWCGGCRGYGDEQQPGRWEAEVVACRYCKGSGVINQKTLEHR